jgi:transcription antitermination factor NusG
MPYTEPEAVIDASQSGVVRREAEAGPIKSGRGGARAGAGRKPKAAVVEVPKPDRLRWYCIRTSQGMEAAVEQSLKDAKFATFLPYAFVAETAARITDHGRTIPSRPAHFIPLFSRYLFVRFSRSENSWRYIPTMPFVENLLNSGPTSPTPVPDRAIEQMRSQCDDANVMLPPEGADDRAIIELGASYSSSAFPGIAGMCIKREDDRVTLLMNIMGSQVPVNAPVASLEKI